MFQHSDKLQGYIITYTHKCLRLLIKKKQFKCFKRNEKLLNIFNLRRFNKITMIKGL